VFTVYANGSMLRDRVTISVHRRDWNLDYTIDNKVITETGSSLPLTFHTEVHPLMYMLTHTILSHLTHKGTGASSMCKFLTHTTALQSVS
jgi:hypothetical protein